MSTKAMHSNLSGSESGTLYPGMSEGRHSSDEKPGRNLSSSAPLVGFLYSVSRIPEGEYWPIYIGKTTIGRGADCTVRLPEMMVSENHASLFVRRLVKSSRLLAELTVTEGINGVFVNDDELAHGAYECHNGDHIKIGPNYELYLVLVDTTELHLSPCESFEPEETEMGQGATGDVMETDYLHDPARRPKGGTVSMDGSGEYTEGFTQVL